MTELMRRWDVTLHPRQAAPLAREHATAPLPVCAARAMMAGHQSLMEDRCAEGKESV